jgi:hypothetical protein
MRFLILDLRFAICDWPFAIAGLSRAAGGYSGGGHESFRALLQICFRHNSPLEFQSDAKLPCPIANRKSEIANP